MNESSSPKRRRFFYGWVIVAVSVVVDAVALGAGNGSFAIFLQPISRALGWSRTTITGAITVQSLANLLVSPVVGTIVDRYGPRLLMCFGATVAAVSFCFIGKVNEPWQFYLLYTIAAAFGLHEIGGLVTTTTVSKWFVRMRGRALAMTFIGNNLGQIIFSPLSAFLIVLVGWGNAWAILGLIVAVIVIPLALLFMRRAPEDMGLLPDGVLPEEASSPSASRAREEPSMTVREALRTRTLWILVIANNLASIAFSGILYHIVAFYTDIGFSLQAAGFFVALNNTFALISKVPWGLVAEHVPVRYCLMANYIARIIAMVNLLVWTSPLRPLIYCFISGFGSHAFGSLQAQIWADYYGRAFVGSIRGILTPFSLFSSLGGPIMAAFVYDTLGSYDAALWTFVATLSLAVIAIYMATPPLPPARQPELGVVSEASASASEVAR